MSSCKELIEEARRFLLEGENWEADALVKALSDRLTAVEGLAAELETEAVLAVFGRADALRDAAQRLRERLDGETQAAPTPQASDGPDPAVRAVAYAIAPILGVDLDNTEPCRMPVKDVWQRAEMFVAATRAYRAAGGE